METAEGTELRIAFRGKISKEIYLRATSLHAGSIWFVLLIFPIVVSASIWFTGKPVGDRSALLGRAIATLVAFLFIPALHRLQRFFLVRHYNKSPYLTEALTGYIAADRFWIESETGHGNLPWDTFIKQKHNDDIILLYRSPAMFNILVAEHFATAEDWRTARQIVTENVPEKAAKR